MKRDILKINEELCNGCGLCVPNCHEGALKIIDGKVRLISELMCDGLGACIGHCPEGAITIETRDAEPYDEIKVMKQMVLKGKNTIIAHLKHLKDHGETGFLQQGASYLREYRNEIDFNPDEILAIVHNYDGRNETPHGRNQHRHHEQGGCPGSRTMEINRPEQIKNEQPETEQQSELKQWPVQMHLINPGASYFHGSDLLLAADCVAFSAGNFHSRHLRGKTLAIACPKLDHGAETYVQKITSLIDNARINTITVLMMEVPCCGGLLHMVKAALSNATRKVPVKMMIVGIAGDILQEEWI